MGLPQHQRTKSGAFSREHGNSLAKNLRKDYPEFYNVRSDAKLENIKAKLGLEHDAPLKEVRKELRKIK
jgi:hypothetical protein